MISTEENPTARIIKALGLEHCRSIRMSMEAGSVVAVVTEQYVSGDQLGRLAYELETNHWVLVSKSEYESKRQSLTTEEREALENAVVLRQCDAKWEEDKNGMADSARARKAKREAATLLSLLERTK